MKLSGYMILLCATPLFLEGCVCDCECVCSPVQISIYTPNSGVTFTRTGTAYQPIEVLDLPFFFHENSSLYEYLLEESSLDLAAGERLSDFNYLIENAAIARNDTISAISYTLTPIEITCCSCLLEDRTVTCEEATDVALKLNSNEINDFNIVLN